MKRLFLVAALLLASTACVDLDQTLTLHANGRIDLLWQMTLPKEVTDLPITKKGAEREAWWMGMVPEEAREYVTPKITEVEGETQLVLDARLPTIEAYDLLRSEFTKKLKENGAPFPMFEPPMVRAVGESRIVEVHLDPRDKAPDVENDKLLGNHWSLHVQSDAPLTDHNATRQDPDGSLFWEMTLGEVQREGLHARATTQLKPFSIPWFAIGAFTLLVGALAALFRRRILG